MVHTRIKWSPSYWIYCLAVKLSVSRAGSLFFRLTRPLGEKNPNSKFGKLWWRFYLFNVILRNDKEELLKTATKPIKLHWVQPYHFDFWNVFFHMSCLSHVLFELARGNRPYLEDEKKIWEQFFEPPVEMLPNTDVDTLPENDDVKDIFFTSKFAPHCKTVVRAWGKLFAEYMQLSEQTRAYIEDERKTILTEPEKTLGVICRGTDYIILAPPTHPKQPKTEKVIEKARQWMEKYGYEKIYLATEEEAIFKQFEDAFPGRILTNKRNYYDVVMKEQSLRDVDFVRFDRENDDYLRGLEYMSSISLLSQCDALIGGNCGGTLFASFANNCRYTRTHIFDCGLY